MRRAVAWTALLGVALALPAVAAAAPASATAPGERPDVLLITVDTLRPDALGFMGGANRTPNLDALAASGRRFVAARTPCPLTLPAHTSLLSGLVPPRHGVRDNGEVLAGSVPLLSERLRTGGYATAAFVSGFPLLRMFGLARGFDHYDDALDEGREGFVERRAAATTAAAVAWLETAPRPWFVWVHYYDPHEPYEPPRSFWKPGPRGAYDGEVESVDSALAPLLARARATPGAIVVFTSDHGEGLGDHREATHGFFLYDSTVRVSLVVARPGRISAGEVAAPVGLVDLAPTLLELTGSAPLPGLDGRSLVPALRGEALAGRELYLETELPWRYFGWAPLRGLLSDGWKLIRAPRPELYDLARDAPERENRIEAERPTARRLAGRLGEWERARSTPAAGEVEAAARERLAALGYLAGSAGAAPTDLRGLADPKDRVEQRDRLTAADRLLRGGRPEEALREFEAVLVAEPDNRMALLRAGLALSRLGRSGAAVERLRRAVAVDPDRAEARFLLAETLGGTAQWGEAAREWEQLVRLQPTRFEAWVNLAFARRQLADRAGERQALGRALALRPDDPAASARLAELGGPSPER